MFKKTVRKLNLTEDGRPWLTDKQLDELYEQIARHPGNSLLEINENVLKLLFRAQVDLNELTKEEYPNVKLVDFHNPDRNSFIAINQFRIDTPGRIKDCIIPDIVLFVNGIPFAVIECKDAEQIHANPMFEAFRQLMRYCNQREETKLAGLKEGEPSLFYPNQILIRTCGDQADFGTITSTEETYFFPWKDIWPEKYRVYEPPLGVERQQETLIQGMLPPETLLDIVRTCTLFMDVGKTRAKIVSRYQQYRAMSKIIHRMRTGQTPSERSGVIWHTQGSGKSLTMVFAIRKIRMCDDLKDFKVCLINDRKDLETQLGVTADLTGEKVNIIKSSDALRKKLSKTASDLNMVMVHKFQEARNAGMPGYLESVLNIVPQYNTFGVVNPSERILLMMDEAHRTQSGDLGDNLFEAFPAATRLAFTGTPLIVVSDKQKTADRFGEYIDKYKLQDAVDDGATVQILYEGKTADAAVDHKHEFDQKVDDAAKKHVESQLRKAKNVETLKGIATREGLVFEDLVKERTDEEIVKLKQKWGATGDLLEADNRIEAIAADLVIHYIDNILPNGFKAQVVCSSKIAAIKYKKHIDQALSDRLAEEQAKPACPGDPSKAAEEDREIYRDDELCRKIAFLKSVVVISSEGTNELAIVTAARKHAKEVDAVANFTRAFDFNNPAAVNTGVAFLIVCDMLLTGFDAPVEQVMYIDKKVKDHNLLQTIARVNRVAKGKSRGYIVDYIGLANHLSKALSIYAAEDQADIKVSLKDLSAEIPILEDRYRRLLNLFINNGVGQIREFVEQTLRKENETQAVLEQAVSLLEDVKLRTTFEVCLNKFLQSLDIVLPNSAATPYRVPAKRFGYILAKVKERYKDESLDISRAGEKVRKIIDEHLISLGINPKIPPVELLSPSFIHEVQKNTSSKAKASEMEHAIRKHCKVEFNKDPTLYTKLSEKLEALIKKYKDNWDELYKQLFDLRKEVEVRAGEAAGWRKPQSCPLL